MPRRSGRPEAAVQALRSIACPTGVNVPAEYERLVSAGVRFTQPPAEMGPVTTAVFDDTCGNLIQIASQN